MKIIAAPDSFKGNQSALAVAEAIERGILRFDSSIEVIKIPMADGGEGTVDAASSMAGGRLVKLTVSGPLGDPVEAEYAVIEESRTAIIEMAAASGLPLVPENRRNPSLTTTRGTGELMMHAVNNGYTKIILGIGGSATNDGGLGAASVFGARFFDAEGRETGITGSSLQEIKTIDISGIDPRLANIEILTACDVKNPFHGPDGAAYVYGPQKGADSAMVKELDKGLQNLAGVIRDSLGIDIANIPGAGAAGGLGGGLVAFFGAKLKSGIELLIEATGLEKALEGADLVITGEGKTDFQTAFGKVPAGVGAAAKRRNIPAVCFSGALGKQVEALYPVGITALFSTANREMTLQYAMDHSIELIEQGAENIARLFYAGMYAQKSAKQGS